MMSSALCLLACCWLRACGVFWTSLGLAGLGGLEKKGCPRRVYVAAVLRQKAGGEVARWRSRRSAAAAGGGGGGAPGRSGGGGQAEATPLSVS